MPIFDQFCFSFVFLGLPKIGPNPSLYLRLLLVASLLILGYDATASSNSEQLGDRLQLTVARTAGSAARSRLAVS